MSEITAIPWTHGTFNAWIGCTKIAPECLHCYAKDENDFRRWNGGTWGPGAPRKITSVDYWKQPFKWDKSAAASGERRRVFSCSLADLFDEETPAWPQERGGKYATARDAFFHGIVANTPNIDWIVLTKRFNDAADYLTDLWGATPWPNVWVVFSAGTQKRHDAAVNAMLGFVATVKGISAEPLLEPVRFNLDAIDWLIVGGESGPQARPFMPGWLNPLPEQCERAGVALFVKQYGSRPIPAMRLKDRKGGNPEEWASSHRVRQFPARAPRLTDGAGK